MRGFDRARDPGGAMSCVLSRNTQGRTLPAPHLPAYILPTLPLHGRNRHENGQIGFQKLSFIQPGQIKLKAASSMI